MTAPEEIRTATERAFVDLVDARMGGAAVSAEVVASESENTRVEVRLAGAFVTDGVVDGTQVLWRPPAEQLATAKLVASHAMAPVGPSHGIGGQHGFSRWADFTNSAAPFRNVLVLDSQVPAGHPHMQRFFLPEPRSLTMLSILKNPASTDPLQTSLGEHLYFSTEGADLRTMLLNGSPVDEHLGRGALEAIMDGEPRLWQDRPDSVQVDLPHKSIHIKSTSTNQKMHNQGLPMRVGPVAMLIWRRKGVEDWVCLEPTVGVAESQDGSLQTDLVTVAPGGNVQMTTVLRAGKKAA